MQNKRFSGIMPALITAFDGEGNLKAESAKRIISRQLAWGVEGFYINGGTGEGLFLSEQTRREHAELAVELCRGKAAVINHVGAVDAISAIRLARHAGEIGCDAISSLVPNYIASYSEDQVLDYYKRLADASGLPVLVYCTGLLKSDPVSFIEKAMQVEGIIGTKYTMFNYYNMQRITELNGGDINVINGPDEMLLLGLTMGADGGIGSTYNLMAPWFMKLYEAFLAGDAKTAKEWQVRINRVITVILKHECIPAIKQAYNVMGYDAGNVAYPGKVFTAEQSAAFEREMIEAGFCFE